LATDSCDRKNILVHHNGGSWIALVLTAAALKTGRAEMAQRAIAIAQKRLQRDQWAEYYDGKQVA